MDLAPVLPVACPFLRNVHHGQIQHFQQAVIGWEYGFGFGHFPQLAVEPFDCIRRVNQTPHRFWIFEISGQCRPVVVPGLVDFRVFGIPFVPKQFQLIPGASSVGAAYTRFKSDISFLMSL